MTGEEQRATESVGLSTSFAMLALDFLVASPAEYERFAAWLAEGGKVSPAPTVEQLAMAGTLLGLMADRLLSEARGMADKLAEHVRDRS